MATERFARLTSVTATDNATGNLIGLNPFGDLSAVGLIRLLQEATIQVDPTLDVDRAVTEREKEMRELHAGWVQAGRPQFR